MCQRYSPCFRNARCALTRALAPAYTRVCARLCAQTETLSNLWHSFKCWLTCREPRWLHHAESAKAEHGTAAAHAHACVHAAPGAELHGHSGDDGLDAHSIASYRSAHKLQRTKRRLTAVGLVAVYLVWAVFAWFIFVRCLCSHGAAFLPAQCADARPRADVRDAGVQAAGRGRGAELRQELGYQLRGGRRL